jgi:hypothetical protein
MWVGGSYYPYKGWPQGAQASAMVHHHAMMQHQSILHQHAMMQFAAGALPGATSPGMVLSAQTIYPIAKAITGVVTSSYKNSRFDNSFAASKVCTQPTAAGEEDAGSGVGATKTSSVKRARRESSEALKIEEEASASLANAHRDTINFPTSSPPGLVQVAPPPDPYAIFIANQQLLHQQKVQYQYQQQQLAYQQQLQHQSAYYSGFYQP